jgi:3-phosphoshikimate 1-carboxyvinyltransferase
MLAALSDGGETRIANLSTSADCANTLECLRQLGASVTHVGTDATVCGVGLDGLRPASAPLDAGNSGTTMRLLAGILAGQPFETRVTGDASLQRRPMGRIIRPLIEMGAQVRATNDEFAPLTISGGRLRPIAYRLPIASAQVKSCVLLAGLFAAGETNVLEPTPTRDHTERLLRAFGADVRRDGERISLRGGSRLRSPGRCVIPGDFSAAAFFIAAALMAESADVTIAGVGVNPTRIGALEAFFNYGDIVRVENRRDAAGEPVADIHIVHAGRVAGAPLRLRGAIIPNLIDELPILAVLGVRRSGIEICDAAELRVKESDRIRLIVENLRRMGADVTERPDGLSAPGGQRLRGAVIETDGDHRIAMAFSIAALVADGASEIANAECAAVSFPDFYDALRGLGATAYSAETK